GPYCSLFIYRLKRKWFLSSTVSHQLYHIFKNEYFPHTPLCRKALVNNPKIDIRDGTYGFKPKYNLKDKKALLRLLDKHDQLGLGGVLLDDVEEGLPNAAKAIKALGDQIVFVTRPDKKKILFYNDKHCQFAVDEEFQKLWRSVPVDSIDEEKIEEYLKKQGISSMQETGPKKVVSFFSVSYFFVLASLNKTFF
ncbi:Transcription initiation factor IIE subunit beta, partial [Xenoophorus captivus]